MNINKEYVLRKIAGEGVLIPTGNASREFNGMINLTDTAVSILEQIGKCSSLKQIAEKMQEEYEVDEKTAEQDVTGFLMELYKRGIVENIPEFESK